MTRLYHGSNMAIERIDLSRSKRGKDFGQGFYLNANPDQAMAMAYVEPDSWMRVSQHCLVLNLMTLLPKNQD